MQDMFIKTFIQDTFIESLYSASLQKFLSLAN